MKHSSKGRVALLLAISVLSRRAARAVELLEVIAYKIVNCK